MSGEDQPRLGVDVLALGEQLAQLAAMSDHQRRQRAAIVGRRLQIEVEQCGRQRRVAHLAQRLEDRAHELGGRQLVAHRRRQRRKRRRARIAAGEQEAPRARLPRLRQQVDDHVLALGEAGGEHRGVGRAVDHQLESAPVLRPRPEREQPARGGDARRLLAAVEDRGERRAQLLLVARRRAQPFEHVREQPHHRLRIDLGLEAQPVLAQHLERPATADAGERLGRERAHHQVGEQLGEWRHRRRRAQVAQRLDGGELQPLVPFEERQQIGDGACVAELPHRLDGGLHDVRVLVVERRPQRLEGAQVAHVTERQHRLQHHVGIGVAQQPHRQPEGARAAHLQHLEAGVAQDVVGLFAQIRLQPLVGDDGGAGAQRALADDRAAVADQPLDGGHPRLGGQRRELIEQLHALFPARLGIIGGGTVGGCLDHRPRPSLAAPGRGCHGWEKLVPGNQRPLAATASRSRTCSTLSASSRMIMRSSSW